MRSCQTNDEDSPVGTDSPIHIYPQEGDCAVSTERRQPFSEPTVPVVVTTQQSDSAKVEIVCCYVVAEGVILIYLRPLPTNLFGIDCFFWKNRIGSEFQFSFKFKLRFRSKFRSGIRSSSDSAHLPWQQNHFRKLTILGQMTLKFPKGKL